MIVVGVDENGLGPRLGPLVVTAAAIDTALYDSKNHRALAQRVGIEDSKRSAAFGKMAWCESVALAVATRLTGSRPRSANALLRAFARESVRKKRARCPKDSQPQCWSESIGLPLFGGDVAAGAEALEQLSAFGVELRSVRASVMCVRQFNEAWEQTRSKTTVDLQAFEALLADMHALHQSDRKIALCGMVGGIRKYKQYLEFGDALTVLRESRASSTYKGLGYDTISFEVSADDRHLPVALASMVGKYLREVWMQRSNRFYKRQLPSLRGASGYHDPVTTAFIKGTARSRRRLNIAEDCFVRTR